MKRYMLGAALCGVLVCAPVMAQDAGQSVETPAPVEAQEAAPAAIEAAPVEDLKTATTAPTIAGPVSGYSYFHRAGATLAEQQADIEACRPQVLALEHGEGWRPPVTTRSGVYTPVYVPSSPAVSPGAAAGAGLVALLAVAVVAENEQRTANVRDMHLNYENCMVARGWRVMLLDQETGRRLDRMNPRRLAEQLETMVGAAAPLGEVSRQFGNEYQYGVPDDVGEMSLSLQVMPDEYWGERPANDIMTNNTREDRRRARERQERQRERAELRRALFQGAPGRGAVEIHPGSLESLPEGAAVILVGSRGPHVRLVRVNPQAGDGADAIMMSSSETPGVFVVPAGEWRLTSLAPRAPATSHCLGAPVFSVSAGDVVFAGSFAADGQPDLGLDGARELLSVRPELAERLRAASYRNGSTFDCGGATYATAFEIADAPYVDGFTGVARVAANAD